MTTEPQDQLDAALAAVLSAHAEINEAMRSGNAEKIAAARKNYEAAHKEYQRVIDRLMKGDDDGR
jgi:hypothetical protein